MSLSVGDDEPAVGIDTLHPRMHDVDAVLGIPLRRMKVDVLRLSAQELLAQRWTGIRRRRICGEDADGFSGLLPTERLRGADTGRPTAHDDHWVAHELDRVA